MKLVRNDVYWNIDSNGNIYPISAIDKYVVDSVDSTIQLKDVPVVGTTSIKKLITVLNQDDNVKDFVEVLSGNIINENQFKIDYTTNEVQFHQSQKGKEIIVKCMSEGRVGSSAKNVYMEKDSNGSAGSDVNRAIVGLSKQIDLMEGNISCVKPLQDEIITARQGNESLSENIYGVKKNIDDLNIDNTKNKTDIATLKNKTLTFINIQEYKDKVVNNDWKPALEYALTQGNIIYFPKGEYRMGYVYIPSNVTIYGDGDDTIFIPTSTGSLFNIVGSRDSKINVTESVEDFSDTIKVANNFKENDFICLRGVRDSLNVYDTGESWCLGFATPNSQGLIYGEFLQVKSATPTEVITKNSTIFPWYYKESVSDDKSLYKRPNSTVEKISFIENVTLRDFKIKGYTTNTINVDFGYNVKIKNVTQDATGYFVEKDKSITFVTFRRSLMCEANGCYFNIDNDYNHPTVDYHFYVNIYKIRGSQDCTFDGCKAFNTTQAFDVTYINSTEPTSDTEFSMPSINSTIKNCYSKNAQQTGMTAHQGTYMTSFINNNIVGSKQGIYTRSKNSLVIGNTVNNTFVKGTTSYGIGIGESNATNSVITNNNISNAYTGIYITDGISDDSYWTYAGLVVSNNTILNFATGILINKRDPYKTDGMFINITDNTLYSTRVLDVNLRGIYVGQGATAITIKNNTISLRLASNLTYGIYLDYDVTDVEVTNNKIRKCKLGLYHRRLSADSNLTKVIVSDIGNLYYECETQQNLVSSLVARSNNLNMSYVNLDSVDSITDVRTDGSLYIANTDGRLYYINKDGTRYKLAIDTTLET